MKIIKINDAYKVITLVPRIFPNESDVLVVKLRNEFTNIEDEIPHTWSYMNNYFTLELGEINALTVDSTLITDDNTIISVDETLIGESYYDLYNKYELTIFRNSTLIYKGKVEVISDDDSIQDFKITPIPTNKIIRF